MRNIQNLGRTAVVLMVVAVTVIGVVVAEKAVSGAYSGSYQVVGRFTAAGEGLHTGSEVSYDGVQVGKVSSISLVHRAAQVALTLSPSFRFPANGTATIRPQNLFGADVVDITSPTGRRGPFLRPGSSIPHTDVASGLTNLLATADPLLKHVDTTDLSLAISELNRATNGEGAQIATGISEGNKLATLLSTTLGAQLTALDSLAAFSGALVPAAPQLNAVSAAANAALPAINRAQAAFQQLLESLTPLANNVAQFLSLYHPDIAQLLVSGANVTRVLLTHQSNIEQTVAGLYHYVYDFAHATGDTLPNGSKIAYFREFIKFSDVNRLVCSLVAPAAGGLAALAPLQAALGSAGTPFDCASQLAAFDKLNPSVRGATAATPASTARQGANVAQQVYKAIGAPSAPTPHSLGGYMSMLLGGL
ncbi:MAG: MCE family protein [Acidimicrobiales bacterium]